MSSTAACFTVAAATRCEVEYSSETAVLLEQSVRDLTIVMSETPVYSISGHVAEESC
jgi:hypothetical protein